MVATELLSFRTPALLDPADLNVEPKAPQTLPQYLGQRPKRLEASDVIAEIPYYDFLYLKNPIEIFACPLMQPYKEAMKMSPEFRLSEVQATNCATIEFSDITNVPVLSHNVTVSSNCSYITKLLSQHLNTIELVKAGKVALEWRMFHDGFLYGCNLASSSSGFDRKMSLQDAKEVARARFAPLPNNKRVSNLSIDFEKNHFEFELTWDSNKNEYAEVKEGFDIISIINRLAAGEVIERLDAGCQHADRVWLDGSWVPSYQNMWIPRLIDTSKGLVCADRALFDEINVAIWSRLRVWPVKVAVDGCEGFIETAKLAKPPPVSRKLMERRKLAIAERDMYRSNTPRLERPILTRAPRNRLVDNPASLVEGTSEYRARFEAIQNFVNKFMADYQPPLPPGIVLDKHLNPSSKDYKEKVWIKERQEEFIRNTKLKQAWTLMYERGLVDADEFRHAMVLTEKALEKTQPSVSIPGYGAPAPLLKLGPDGNVSQDYNVKSHMMYHQGKAPIQHYQFRRNYRAYLHMRKKNPEAFKKENPSYRACKSLKDFWKITWKKANHYVDEFNYMTCFLQPEPGSLYQPYNLTNSVTGETVEIKFIPYPGQLYKGYVVRSDQPGVRYDDIDSRGNFCGYVRTADLRAKEKDDSEKFEDWLAQLGITQEQYEFYSVHDPQWLTMQEQLFYQRTQEQALQEQEMARTPIWRQLASAFGF